MQIMKNDFKKKVCYYFSKTGAYMLFFIKTIIRITFLFPIAIPFSSYSFIISQDTVIRKVLNNSLEYKKIQAHEETQLQGLGEAEAFLDWRFFINTAFNSKESNTLNVFENPLQEKIEILTGVEKRFFTGTKLKMQYLHFHIDREFTPEFKKISTSPPTTLTQRIEFSLEQDLLRNFFGYEDRIKLNIASMQSEKQKIKIQEDIEDLIIQSLEQFWHTYIHYLSLNLKILKKKDYKELTKITLRKNKHRYTKPGELSQIKAELEKAKQELTLQKIIYENELKKLLNLLNIETTTKVAFKLDRIIPSPPSFDENLKKTPRTISLLQKSLSIKKELLKTQIANAKPTLQLFTTYGFGGYERDISSTFDSLTNRDNQNYSIGLKMTYALPSTGVRSRRINLAEHSVEESRLELEITKKNFKQMMEHNQKNLQALYSVLKKAEKIDRLRTQSYKEIRKAFLQGRLDVFQLISAKELTLLSKMEKADFKAQYYQTLALAYAMRDETSILYK